MVDKNGNELPEIWLVEHCQYCHPSGHEFECSPVIAFKHIEDAKRYLELNGDKCAKEACLRIEGVSFVWD